MYVIRVLALVLSMLPDIAPGHDNIVHCGHPVLGLHQALQALGQTFLEGEKVDTGPT